MKRLLGLVGATLALVCASISSAPNHSDDTDPLDPEAFAAAFREQSECWSAWGGLIRQWKQAGGGFGASMIETRQQIAADKVSDFARLVRRAWSRQVVAEPSETLGHWPIPDNRFRSVAMAATGEGLVPKDCEGIFWIDDLLWDDLRFASGGPPKARRFAETPRDMNWDSPYAQRWTRYWVFANVE